MPLVPTHCRPQTARQRRPRQSQLDDDDGRPTRTQLKHPPLHARDDNRWTSSIHIRPAPSTHHAAPVLYFHPKYPSKQDREDLFLRRYRYSDAEARTHARTSSSNLTSPPNEEEKPRTQTSPLRRSHRHSALARTPTNRLVPALASALDAETARGLDRAERLSPGSETSPVPPIQQPRARVPVLPTAGRARPNPAIQPIRAPNVTARK